MFFHEWGETDNDQKEMNHTNELYWNKDSELNDGHI